MTPERWAKIESIFHQAAELPPAQRANFLERECGNDSELRREVESLLRQSDGGEATFRREFLQGAVDAIGTEPTPPPTPTKNRAPWWLLGLVASFLATSAFICYLVIWGAAELRGISPNFDAQGMVIRTLEPDSLAARSGLRAGDRVLMIDLRPIRVASEWTAATGTWELGREHQWVVARGDERITLTIIPESSTFESRLSEGYDIYLGHLFSGLIVGLLVVWKRPGDRVAQFGAWFLMTASIAYGLPQGWAGLWRSLPAPVQIPLWVTQISRFVLEGIFLSFFLIFPRRLFTSRWPWFVLWVPVLATLPWRVVGFYNVINPREGAAVPPWILQAGFMRTIAYLLLGIGVLAFSYRRLMDSNEKRRVRVLMVGTALSAISTIVTVLIDSFFGRNSYQANLLLIPFFPVNSALFICLAYAILRHRILDIRVIVRQGLQYALARGFVVGLVPALGVLLLADLTVNSQETLARIMQSRGWIYFALAGIAFAIHRNRERWLGAIDRRFFRERYNAHRVLSQVVEEIRVARSLERVAGRVVTQIETALHPEFVAIMQQPHEHSEYRVLSLAPPSAMPMAPATLPAESKLVGLARILGKPIEVFTTDAAWLERRLPRQEIDLFRQKRVDLVVPVEGFVEGRQSLLILGPKKSEEPYTSEDQELLQAIAGSLSLLIGQPAPAVATPPRTLSTRYRLERVLGRGGMGTVYEAIDTALDRRVAIKVISDELLGSAEAAERFQREARASASFSHPNVVIVHDYGVEGSRAFLVMELLEGKTLREELVQQQKLEPPRVLQILRETCGAIDAAHRRMLIHRDLKPENIYLTPLCAKVLDFGIAKFLPTRGDDAATAITAQTRTGVIVGTIAYMSPEQLLGESSDVAWDLWALSVVTYEVLTGTLPFPKVSTVDWRRSVLDGKFIPTEKWDAFFQRAFSPDRTQRPQSASQFIGSLEEIL